MSIATTDNKVTYSGNGATTEWPFAFTVLEASHLRVILTNANGVETTLTSDYVVDLTNKKVTYPGYLSGEEPDVTEQPPILPTGSYITLLRVVPYTQETDLGERWPFTTIEAALDKLTMESQQLAEGVARAVKTPVSSDISPDEILESIKTSETNAAGSATAASAAKTAAELAETNAEVAQEAAESANVSAQAVLGGATLAIAESTGCGVITGLQALPQSTPDMTVQVSDGVAHMPDGKRFETASVAALAVNAADATNPRIDLVYLSSVGVVAYLAGTAAAAPVAPTLPGASLPIANINVKAGATSIGAECISDVRIIKPVFSDADNSNPKYMCAYFCDTVFRQSVEYFTSFVDHAKSSGFKEINILLHINSDGSTTEDVTKFSVYNAIATARQIPITCLKVHGSYLSTNYLSNVYEALAKLPNVTTVFVFNEQFNLVYANGLTYPAQIKAQFPNVTKVGCTVDYATAFKTWLPSVTGELTAIQNAYDVLGVHMYPSCGSYAEARSTTYEQCLMAFNEFKLAIPWEKELWLTESGVLPYWQFLELPESYTLGNLTDTERTIDPQRLFYRALHNSDFANRARVVIPWYTESWMYDDTLGMWDSFKNIVVSR